MRVQVVWASRAAFPFERDWLQLLLGRQDFLKTDPDFRLPKEPVVLIYDAGGDGRSYIFELIRNRTPFGVILLSDEWLSEDVSWVDSEFCRFLYRNYLHPGQSAHPKIRVFALGFKSGFTGSSKPLRDREFAWSFAGAVHRHRRAAIREFSVLRPHWLTATRSFNSSDGLGTQDYARVLANSCFVLCPPGHRNNDSFRLYEALEAGAIPVALRSDLLHWYWPSYWAFVFQEEELPFVVESTWKRCRERVQELLAGKARLEERQAACRALWERTKQRYVTELRGALEGLSEGLPVVLPPIPKKPLALRKGLFKRPLKDRIRRLLRQLVLGGVRASG